MVADTIHKQKRLVSVEDETKDVKVALSPRIHMVGGTKTEVESNEGGKTIVKIEGAKKHYL